MDWPILLSIFGIGITILNKLRGVHSCQNCKRSAKETVLKELLKSISENNIPKREIISATIKSVFRDYHVKELDVVTVDEVIDDLIRDVSSNPFLDSKYRKQIQNELLAMKLD